MTYHSCWGDRIQLQQVILNLLINAIEAMSGVREGQRELWVSSEKVTGISGESQEAKFADKALADAEWSHVLIAVRDSGPVLDPKALDHLDLASVFKKLDNRIVSPKN
jgi:signal transduction histidine kinase